MLQLPEAVIIAGGKGTRLGLPDLPKPMAPLLGQPLLEYQIRLLKNAGVKRVHILAGYLADKIVAYFGDGAAWGIEIRYWIESSPLGTAGAVLQLAGVMTGDFFVLYGDVFVDMDLLSLYRFHRSMAGDGTLTVHPNDHPHDSDLVALGPDKSIRAFIPKPHAPGQEYRNVVNAALYVLGPEVFPFIPRDRPSDFGKDVFPAMLAAGKKLLAYATPEYLKDMGTPHRLESVSQAVLAGKPARRNLANWQKAIFLDRDGIINVERGGILHPDDFELLPGTVQALKLIHSSDYLAIVVTNQPFLAKGQMSPADLDRVHARMDTLLGREGAYIDALYYCPHHPEKGWPGEVPELKIDCRCRKPGPGLLEQAAADFHIDLSESYIVGDRIQDTKAGIAAGLKGSLLVAPGAAGKPGEFTRRHDTLLEAVCSILEDRT